MGRRHGQLVPLSPPMPKFLDSLLVRFTTNLIRPAFRNDSNSLRGPCYAAL